MFVDLPSDAIWDAVQMAFCRLGPLFHAGLHLYAKTCIYSSYPMQVAAGEFIRS